MNVNFGLMPPFAERTKKSDRKKMYTERARAALGEWLSGVQQRDLQHA
jgi:methylenetetrahydrofolate--tRNA-(uracil-5-)-methyltransferase